MVKFGQMLWILDLTSKSSIGYWTFYFKIQRFFHFRNADRILRLEKWNEVKKMITPMLDLEIIRITTEMSEKHLILLLSQCINVKEIFMGLSTSISDKVWSEVLTKNSFNKLEKINIQKCSKVNLSNFKKN